MLRLVALAASALLIVGGSVTGCGSTRPEPVPLVPFGDFEVGRSGGVAGVQDILYVRSDGVALLVSNRSAAGRFSASTMDRLRTLLESEELRREVAGTTDDDSPRCSDLFSTSVVMGSLRMSVEEPCGSEKQPATPAFDEILTLTAAARQGDFDGPVGVAEPHLVGLRFARVAAPDQTGYLLTVSADGHGTLAVDGRPGRRRVLTTADQDVLRLLVARLVHKPITACRAGVHYRLTISGSPASSGPDCGYRDRYREFAATAALLETVFDL